MLHIERSTRGRTLVRTGLLWASCLLFSVDRSSFAATIVDLTTIGSSGTINGALFEQITPKHSTGTGVINAFSQQSPQGNATSSRAYNTTANNVLNNGSADNFNHSITLGDISVTNRGGRNYREFFLDINENSGNGSEFISLDEVQVFVGGTANNNIATFTNGVLNHDGTLVYRMDAGNDSWVALNYSLAAGSGSGDMFLLIPNELFAGFSNSDVVTLYSEFGLQGLNPSGFLGDFGGSDGFEEWALRVPPIFDYVLVPEPASATLLCLALAALSRFRRR